MDVVVVGSDGGAAGFDGAEVVVVGDVSSAESAVSDEQAATIAEAPSARKTRRETGNSGNIGSINQSSIVEVAIGCDHTRSGPACSRHFEPPIHSRRTRFPTSSAQKRRP